MVHESRSPPRRRRRYPDGQDEGYSRRDRSGGGFRGRDDKNGGSRRNVGDRYKDWSSDRSRGYGERDDRRPAYNERERDRERNRDRERYRDGARDTDRAGPSRRSA